MKGRGWTKGRGRPGIAPVCKREGSETSVCGEREGGVSPNHWACIESLTFFQFITVKRLLPGT